MTDELIDDAGGHRVAEPGEVGMHRGRIAEFLERSRREVDEGLLPSCQVALARHGRVVAARTFGAEPAARYVTYSCTKAITAGAMWRVLGDGLVARDTRVAEIEPVFGTNGKDVVTVEQLLTHSCGFPEAPMGDADWEDPARRLDRFASWRLHWKPGSRFVYHGTSASWVLAHIIETVTGRDFRDYVRDEVLLPLDLPALQLGTPIEDQGDVLDVASVGPPLTQEDLDALGDTVRLDISAIGAVESDLLRHNDPDVRRVGQPAGGAIGHATDLAMYYQGMLANPGELWDPAWLSLGTSEVLCELTDRMIGVPANRTLGLVLAGDDGNSMMRGFGVGTSGRAFGHMGAGGQVAWADPASGLSVAYLTNGLDRDPVRMGGRTFSISTRAAKTVTGG